MGDVDTTQDQIPMGNQTMNVVTAADAGSPLQQSLCHDQVLHGGDFQITVSAFHKSNRDMQPFQQHSFIRSHVPVLFRLQGRL